MAKGPETALKEKVLAALKKQGGYWFKVHGNTFTNRGIPDIIGCYQGHFVGLELKAIGEKPTEIQQFHLSLISQAGGIQGVAETVSQALAIISRGIENSPLLLTDKQSSDIIRVSKTIPKEVTRSGKKNEESRTTGARGTRRRGL